MDMQLGDVPATWADISLRAIDRYRPVTPVADGVAQFVALVPGLLQRLSGASPVSLSQAGGPPNDR